jgi:flagellar basal-body rod modification protein FlgD
MTNPATSATATAPTGSNVLDRYSVENAKNATRPSQNPGVSRDSFLTLLVTQLRNQDPLSPVGNTEFITQLAQFQSLESQLDTNQKIQDLVAIQESQLALSGLSQAALLVGKNVTWIDGDGNEGAGTVTSVTVENGVMMINTPNGKVPVGALTSIGVANPSAGSNGGTDPASGSQPSASSGQPTLRSNDTTTPPDSGPEGTLQHNS